MQTNLGMKKTNEMDNIFTKPANLDISDILSKTTPKLKNKYFSRSGKRMQSVSLKEDMFSAMYHKKSTRTRKSCGILTDNNNNHFNNNKHKLNSVHRTSKCYLTNNKENKLVKKLQKRCSADLFSSEPIENRRTCFEPVKPCKQVPYPHNNSNVALDLWTSGDNEVELVYDVVLMRLIEKSNDIETGSITESIASSTDLDNNINEFNETHKYKHIERLPQVTMTSFLHKPHVAKISEVQPIDIPIDQNSYLDETLYQGLPQVAKGKQNIVATKVIASCKVEYDKSEIMKGEYEYECNNESLADAHVGKSIESTIEVVNKDVTGITSSMDNILCCFKKGSHSDEFVDFSSASEDLTVNVNNVDCNTSCSSTYTHLNIELPDFNSHSQLNINADVIEDKIYNNADGPSKKNVSQQVVDSMQKKKRKKRKRYLPKGWKGKIEVIPNNDIISPYRQARLRNFDQKDTPTGYDDIIDINVRRYREIRNIIGTPVKSAPKKLFTTPVTSKKRIFIDEPSTVCKRRRKLMSKNQAILQLEDMMDFSTVATTTPSPSSSPSTPTPSSTPSTPTPSSTPSTHLLSSNPRSANSEKCQKYPLRPRRNNTFGIPTELSTFIAKFQSEKNAGRKFLN